MICYAPKTEPRLQSYDAMNICKKLGLGQKVNRSRSGFGARTSRSVGDFAGTVRGVARVVEDRWIRSSLGRIRLGRQGATRGGVEPAWRRRMATGRDGSARRGGGRRWRRRGGATRHGRRGVKEAGGAASGTRRTCVTPWLGAGGVGGFVRPDRTCPTRREEEDLG